MSFLPPRPRRVMPTTLDGPPIALPLPHVEEVGSPQESLEQPRLTSSLESLITPSRLH
ncbi:hypothetical protein CRG98_007542 [Punica granatum]|uniref:Uncharacterized protein n=1 Tax=Punica granatum TaxID=22663 RepID=A0A2I0KUD4_PUNGR|nr:hypothetical protein CRG98_007542 [Punica granatum]